MGLGDGFKNTKMKRLHLLIQPLIEPRIIKVSQYGIQEKVERAGTLP